MPALNNVTTGNAYSDANTLECPNSQRATVEVNNAAIFYQRTGPELVGVAPRAEVFMEETYLIPGIHQVSGRMTRFRVRSAVAGTPAQVTVRALP